MNGYSRTTMYSGSSPRTWGTPAAAPCVDVVSRFIPTYMGNATSAHSGRSGSSVHPYVHGERFPSCCNLQNSYGSSPRTWGTRELSHLRARSRRFIPTYMGNAYSLGHILQNRTVHPHVHGERSGATTDLIGDAGSSPRTWGTPPARCRGRVVSRFIPTYMGNANGDTVALDSVSVHPHVHGERSCNRHPVITCSGSSPRTWGTHAERSC